MNESDSERLANYLESYGYALAQNINTAGAVILTTCAVRQMAEDRVYGLAPQIKANNPNCKLILTGCLSGRSDVQERLKDVVDIWLPIFSLPKLIKLLEPERTEINDETGSYLSILPRYSSTFTAFVPIGNGCDNWCTYCAVPSARGREVYRPAEEVLAECRALISAGYKEITLIAQNVNSYQSDDYNFAQLLKAVAELPGEFWLRYATSHPKDMSDELIAVMAGNQKICQHIHLPAQAGDNEVLARMNRKYTREHYLALINKIRTAMPEAAITTDIIVGFPGETHEQFLCTAELFRQAKYDLAYLAEFSPRSGTPAARMIDDVSAGEKSQRKKALDEILSRTALENNQKFLNPEVEVLVNSARGERCFGKTKTYQTVQCQGDKSLVGQVVKVKINEVKNFGLYGELVK